MTETLEHDVEPTEPATRERNRLYQVAAWVAIVAGTIFIVGAIFFTGFFLGRHSGGHPHGGWRHQDSGEFQRPFGPPMMPMGPGSPGMGPGMGPFDRDDRGPAPVGPGPGTNPTATPSPRP